MKYVLLVLLTLFTTPLIAQVGPPGPPIPRPVSRVQHLPISLNVRPIALNITEFQQVKPGTITIIGSGTVNAQPDEGYIKFSVVCKRDTTGEAVRANSGMMIGLYNSLEELGVTRVNIQTINYDVRQVYKRVKTVRQNSAGRDYDDYENVPDGFQVTNIIRVTVCELGVFGKVIDAASQWTDNISSVSFGASKAVSLRMEARRLAVADAKFRAELLTEGLGAGLGRVMSIIENVSYMPPPQQYRNRSANSSQQPTPISGGSLSFSSKISVTWEIKQ